MNFRSLVAGAALAVSALTAQAAPVLVMRGVGGVDLSHLLIGQTFQVEVIIQGGAAGEKDAGFSGGGNLDPDGSPALNITNFVNGTVKSGAEWNLDPSLFIFDYTAVAEGSGFLATDSQCLNSNFQDYGCNFSSGPLAFTVRDPNKLPEPATLALTGLALLGLGAFRRRAA
ncbi:PEP-CTERM sorting domain-containing protein [Roseateles sp. NT4]|uniref:PEP-CTERM sorting domain-containing protein n=1 Tax=Roseateles sp. NT4 TaxID=3453715 RepID=UPI003EEDA751